MNQLNHLVNKGFKLLLFIHGLITLAASLVLIVAPGAIPQTVNIDLSVNQYLLSYFLGAAELSVAFLSIFARGIEDRKSLRLIAASFIVFHMTTGLLESYAVLQGASHKLIFNIVLRVLISVLFWYFGLQRNSTANLHK